MIHSGIGVNASYDRGVGRNSSVTNNNSLLQGSKIDLSITNNLNIRGGNVRAFNEFKANIGGDLNIQSQKDYSRSKNNNFGISAGLAWSGLGADKNGPTSKNSGVSSISFGANGGNSRSSSSGS